MSKSTLDRASEWLLGPAQPAQTAPEAEQDPQSLYGNAFLGGLFDFGEDDGGAAIREMVAETRADIGARVALDELLTTEEGVDGKANVTPEEYEEMVALYADISRGKTNLKIDTSGMSDEEAEAFRSGTMADMAKLMQTKSGRALFDELAHNEDGRTVTLRGASDPDAPSTSPLWKGREFAHLDVEEQWEQNAALERGEQLDSRIQ